MAVLKCKMCGGDLNVMGDSTVAECEYCGSKQTVPSVDNEKKITLFTRANRLRSGCEFDKAFGVYESIVAEFPEEAEAYWGLVLCKYGIEYVDDPKTGKKIPTCHRSSFDSVLEDGDFKMAMEYSDAISRTVYREEAKTIENLRVAIIEVSSKEEPYDIFICYKETAEDGQRTIDSVLAQDVYDELTSKGYKVFFSRITLEDKLGVEFEPYIFAALNSAKIMLAFGTDYEYYNAVWVKNEWSRFLSLIAKGEKKTLIPCYKDIDAYDMPTEFKRLQAQDMGKVGAIQDLIRGIEKILGKKEKETVVIQGGNSSNMQALLKRGSLALEDCEWEQADEFFEEVLNQNPECAEAYLGKLFALKHCCTLEELSNTYISAHNKEKEDKLQACEENSEKVKEAVSMYAIEGYLEEQEIENLYRFDRSYKTKLESIKSNKNKAIEQINKEKLWIRANQYAVGELKTSLDAMVQNLLSFYDNKIVKAEIEDRNAVELVQIEYNRFLSATDIKAHEQYELAMSRRENDYNELLKQFKGASEIEEYKAVQKGLLKLKGYRDSEVLSKQCVEKIECIDKEQKLETKQREEERRHQEILLAQKRKKMLSIIGGFIMICVVVVIGIYIFTLESKYNEAQKLVQNGQYEKAISIFEELEGYKDSQEQIDIAKIESEYRRAIAIEEEYPIDAALFYIENSAYSDCEERLLNFTERYITQCINNGDYVSGIDYLVACSEAGNRTITDKYTDILNYSQGMIAMENGDLALAMQFFSQSNNYMDADDKYALCDLYDDYCGVWMFEGQKCTQNYSENLSSEVGEIISYAGWNQSPGKDVEVRIKILDETVKILYNVEGLTEEIEYCDEFKVRSRYNEYTVSLVDGTLTYTCYKDLDFTTVDFQFIYYLELPK